MAEVGYFLSSEEHGPKALVAQGQQAERAGFGSVMISDHYHPWLESQGESPFVWSVIGALGATTNLRVATGVTCPTVRIHPAVIAQAAATSALLCEGRFSLGVGTGEALNEHIVGDHWPIADVRLDMLEEAIAVMRILWLGREMSHHGRYYTVENARLYSCPEDPPPVLISGFGPKSTSLAARAGDGYVTTKSDRESVEHYRSEGGTGPVVGAVKVCWGADESACAKLAHDRWRSEALPGQLAQELPVTTHFEQASELVTQEMVAASISCGPDPQRHADAIGAYFAAGFDQVYVNQIGDDQGGFFDAFAREIRPRLGL
ncbi:MAG: TIGR03557 family F420-dependent LLM class oxidoreductase [Actinomycetota bacterium]